MKTLTPETRKKAIQLLGRMGAILEKCGGPGGQPGPCPVGNKPRPASDDSRIAAKDMSKKAQDQTHAALKGQFEGASKDKANLMAHHAREAHTSAGLAMRQTNGGKAMRELHAKAHDHHTKAAEMHGKESGSAHQKAAKMHQAAAHGHATLAGLKD